MGWRARSTRHADQSTGRIDDLATNLRTLAPLATTVGVQGSQLEDLARDMNTAVHAINGRLDAIIIQTTETNGRLRTVERAVAFAQGAAAVVTAAGVGGIAVKLLFS